MTGARQSFKTADVLLVEVEADHEGLVNLVPNPDGSLGGWGWLTPIGGTAVTGSDGYLTYTWTTAGRKWFTTTSMPVTGGDSIGAAWTHDGDGWLTAWIEFYDENGEFLSYEQTPPLARHGRQGYPSVSIPVAAVYARLTIEVHADQAGNQPTGAGSLTVTDVVVATSRHGEVPSWTLSLMSAEDPTPPQFVCDWGRTSTVQSDLSNSAVGAFCIQLDTVDNVPVTDGTWTAALDTAVAVTAGATYSLTASARGERAWGTPVDVQFSIDWFDAGGASLGADTVADVALVNEHVWALATGYATAPAGSEEAVLAIRIRDGIGDADGLGGTGVRVYSVDGLYLTDGTGMEPMGAIPPIGFNDVTGVHNTLSITRPVLDVGVLSATIIGEAMDPAVVDTIRPGRKVRVSAKAGGMWRPIFTGTTSRAQTSYYPSNVTGKRAKITLTATDACTLLAATAQPKGVGTIAELTDLLEPAGIPWNVNGNPNGGPVATVVATDDNASLLDQLVRTRDTAHAYVWIDRFGTVQAWDGASIATAATPISDDDFNASALIGFDTQACVTTVNLTNWVGDASIQAGPFTDGPALRQWGVRTASYTLNAVADPQAWANTVLAANSTPAVTLSQITIPLAAQVDLDTWAAIDLYALFGVTFTGSPSYTGNVRVTGVTHSIASDKWLLRLDLTADGRLPLPTA